MFRRTLLGGTVSSFLALACRSGFAGSFEQLTKTKKRCIILWMAGGPSQMETFDPKPGAPTGGPTQALETEVADLKICEWLPQMAKMAPHLNVLRSLTAREGEHTRATSLMHTGFSPIAAFPRPELGCLVAEAEATHGNSEMPGFVALGGQDTLRVGPAYLGDPLAAFEIADSDSTLRLLKQLKRGRNRFELMQDLSRDFESRYRHPNVRRQQATIKRIEGLLDSKLAEELDMSRDAAELSRYGSGEFAKNVFLARKLIESGVSCVEVQLGGWDTHINNFRDVERLCGELDKPWAALLRDLQERNLWEDTLVLWMGDFGRTPTINGNQGRDHFPKISNAVLAGGGLPQGQVIGRTNANGTSIEEAPVTVPDLFATILGQFGIAPDEEYSTEFDSPTQATDGGKVIPQLVV